MYTNTVLIVDDSEIIMKVLSVMISKEGHQVLSAVDGKDALQFLDGTNIDLLITDLNMPNMNGAELISTVRADERYRYLPAILFFKDSRENEIKIMEASGATILFDKNNIRENIIPVVKKMLA